MNDSSTQISELKKMVQEFVNQRDWNKFHNLKNLSMLISTEAAELMEIFRWTNEKELEDILSKKRINIEHEISDIFFGLLTFCNNANIDLTNALKEKIVLNNQKYPADKVKGKSLKYSEY